MEGFIHDTVDIEQPQENLNNMLCIVVDQVGAFFKSAVIFQLYPAGGSLAG